MSLTEKALPVERLAALSDGIFAIAMTILVLNINIPDKNIVADMGLYKALLNQSQEFFSYFLSFFLLGIFWIIQHRQMNILIKTNASHIWIIIWLLMFICLVPFTASLQSDYGDDPVGATMFNANMLIIGIIFLISWLYSTSNHKLIQKDFSQVKIKKGIWNILIFISVSIAAIIAGFFITAWSGMFFLLIPILKTLNNKLQRS